MPKLRDALIEAVSLHQGWEESAVAMVDEAIMPVLERITDILSPVQDYIWAGKWRVLKVLEMLKENSDGN